MKPYIHALSSVRRWGGREEDYFPIHDLMDSTKGVIADNRHRLIFHNAYAIAHILPKIFNDTFINSDGKRVSTKDVGEQHCLEDFHGYIPSLQDYIENMQIKDWMSGKGKSPSALFILGQKD